MLPDFDESADGDAAFFRMKAGNRQVFPLETAQPTMRLGRVFE
jgi:hypothetical protein